MMLRTFAATLAVAAGLVFAGPALASTYLVTGTADTVGSPCTPQGDPDVFNCPSLRRAVTEANANPADANDVFLYAGTYTLSLGELVLESGTSLTGSGARVTAIDGATASRVIHVPVGATGVSVYNLTVKSGYVVSNRGANILNEGELDLLLVRVFDGIADTGSTGGGIANYGGNLTINSSLIDGNSAIFTGGGISNEVRSGTPSTLDVSDSTFASNTGSTGSAIGTDGTGNTVTLNQVTFNVNEPGTTLTIATPGQNVTTYGSIFESVAGTHCGATKPTDLGYNLDAGTSCNFSGTSLSGTDAQLSGGLVNAGGPTDVFTIPVDSPAEDLVATCGSGLDQRAFRRDPNPFAACDAGAYEIGGQPIIELPPIPTPTPPPAPPVQTPTPSPTPAPTPVPAGSVGADEVKGQVLIRDPKTKRFVPFDAGLVKSGDELDTRKGTVELTDSHGDKAQFFDGIFKVSTNGKLTTLTLSEPLDCSKKGKARASAKKPKTRKLWGKGKGAFKTKGTYSAATVRGTTWLVQDTCTTTTTRVTEGAVTVQDFAKKKTIVLRKGGKPYVARAKKK